MKTAVILRLSLVVALCNGPTLTHAGPVPLPTIGLPITRNYTLEDIGDLSRGVRLTFDPIGRVAVISGDAYVVLNDTAWIDLADKHDDSLTMLQVVTDRAGISYFGALATWGVAEYTSEGKLRPRRFPVANSPAWVASTNFTHILPLDGGVYFAGSEGIVYWDRTSDEQIFFHVPGIATIFALNGQVYASSHLAGTQQINLPTRRIEPLEDGLLSSITVDRVAPLSDGRALLSTVGRRLLLFDGQTVQDWEGRLGARPPGRVSAVQALHDGAVAIAINGHGLFILGENGELQLSLTSPEYHRIHDLAAQESGVLWVATESAVQKLLYGSPVTIVDQRLGVPIGWPQVVTWQDRTIISSSGRLYESGLAADGWSTRFELMPVQPEFGAWGLAVFGPHLLVGNGRGVYSRSGDRFEHVLSGLDVSRLVMVSEDFCYVLGATAITAIRLVDGRWVECAERIPGVGFPAVARSAAGAAWIELGADRAARISYDQGKLQSRLFEQFPWTEPQWINVGVVDHTVVLSGGSAGALFFDENTGELGAAPEIQRLLAAAPDPILRISRDRQGGLWATHERGASVVRPDPSASSGYHFDTSFMRHVRDHQPMLHFTGPGDVWLSTEKTLYHIASDAAEVAPARLQPRLVAITDRRTGAELYSARHAREPVSQFSYAQNSLALRFFAGGYFTLRPPEYEFTVAGGTTPWSVRSTDSLLPLHDLHEGSYRVSVRILDRAEPLPEPLTVEFTIAPPWYRSSFAYSAYGIGAILGAWGGLFWAVRRTRRRNAYLEELVQERTGELQAAMEKLQEETRNAATLAERNRLAGEIHDSLQQGLSGLMLQLGATLKLPGLTPELRSRLEVAKKMVSFTRHEVQQAVWDLESPLLEKADLTDALKQMAAHISAGKPHVGIKSSGTSTAIPPATQHQLLRIAQEAITNAVRHGKARKIFVHLDYTATEVSLEVFDDGCGFVPQEVFGPGLGHFGLRGLRARATRINADLEIISAPNRGTTVRIVIPLARSAPPIHALVAST